MPPLPPELRLLHLLALNAVVAVAACRFAKKRTAPTRLAVAVDAFLIWYGIQYLAVALPGLLGILGPASMTLAAAAMAGLLWWAAGRGDPRPVPKAISGSQLWVWPAALALAGALLIVLVWRQWVLPPVANDPLTYHLPAAVEWLQTGRIGAYQTWFFNPANTYSPLCGSTVLAWLIAPLGNDVIARFAQVPAAILLLLAVGQLARHLGGGSAAAVVGLAAVLGRPAVSQATLAKDDLFVAALFAVAAAGLSRDRLKDDLAPWRLGAAVGLMLAVKFTALLALPLLLLAIDAPWRAGWRWRRYGTAVGAAAALAGPWYLRNLIAFGNPVFPVSVLGLPGLFTTARAAELRTVGGAWATVTGGYAGTTMPLAIGLLTVWVAAVASAGRAAWADPLARLCLIGPAVGIGLFLALSPYPEARFLLPTLGLLAASAGLIYCRNHAAGWAAAGGLAAVAAATGFVPSQTAINLPSAAVLAAVMMAIHAAWRWAPPRGREVAALVASLLLAAAVYVEWTPSLNAYRQTTTVSWESNYGELGAAWAAAREATGAGSTVAYAGTHFTYPLAGFELDRRVIYCPSRPNVRTVAELGWLGRGLSGREIDRAATAAAVRGADREVWLENLRREKVDFLLVAKPDGREVPELAWARQMPGRFERVFENGAAAGYRVR